MERVLENCKPHNVFSFFEDLCQIPRETGNTAAVTKYLVDFAISRKLEYICDEIGNVIIKKNASEGYNDHAPVILQGHTDMVCEKNYEQGGKHDFKKDPLNLAIMDDYLYARGTTLGADDGIAVAYMLAILDDNTLKHPPIEAVFTVDEEDGMKGAIYLDTSVLEGRRMINLDHEIEGELLTCCAGGSRVKLSLPADYITTKGTKYNLVICGLNGGHSGLEINKGRGNANILMGRLLLEISKHIEYDLCDLRGGLTDSAICRESKAEIMISDSDIDIIEDCIERFKLGIEEEFNDTESNLTIYGENAGECEKDAVTDHCKRQILFLLNILPDGIIRLTHNGDDIVKTSSNAGIMKLDKDSFKLRINMRSLSEHEKRTLSDKMEYLITTIGGSYKVETDYPAWEYKEYSDIRDIAFDAFQDVFEHNPILTGFHAGLECGVFYEKIPNLDIVSFGPMIYDIHTPKERMNITSAAETYEFLLRILSIC